MPPQPARVDIRDIANFLAETEGLEPTEMQALRQQYFNKYVLQHWNTFTEQQRNGLTQAFGQGVKMPPASADAEYRRDVMARGGNPNDPAQSGGGAVGLGSTADSVGQAFREGGPTSALWEAGPFGGTSSMADPMGYIGGAARGLFAGARLPVTGLRQLPSMLMNPNPMMQRSAMQVLRDMGTKGMEWGSAGMIPLATAIGRGLWRRLPFGQGAQALPRAAGGAAEVAAPAATSEASGAAPGIRPRVRYGPDESGAPQITIP